MDSVWNSSSPPALLCGICDAVVDMLCHTTAIATITMDPQQGVWTRANHAYGGVFPWNRRSLGHPRVTGVRDES
jgi:hypothetical protein